MLVEYMLLGGLECGLLLALVSYIGNKKGWDYDLCGVVFMALFLPVFLASAGMGLVRIVKAVGVGVLFNIFMFAPLYIVTELSKEK